LSAVVMKRRSLAAGWRSARIRRQDWSMATSMRLTTRSFCLTCSARVASRSTTARTLLAMAASTRPPISRSCSRSVVSSAS